MSKHDKTLQRLVATPTPANIKWDDLVGALKSLGYELLKGDGSRRKFVFPGTNEVIAVHCPHPQPDVKQYVTRLVAEHLKLHGRI